MAAPPGSLHKDRDVWLAAWALMASRFADEPSGAIGLVIDGRLSDELKGAIGPYGRTLPVTVDITPELGFSELTRRAGEACQCALVSAAGEPTNVGPLPRFRFHDRPAGPPVATEALVGDELRLVVGAGEASVVSSPDWVGADEAEQVALTLGSLLDELAAEAELRADDAVGAGRHKGWTSSALSCPAPARALRPVHELVADIAATHAERAAVRAGDISLSYGELDGRANALALRVLELGAGPANR